MNDEKRETSISAWICEEGETKSDMASVSRPKGCVSFGFKFRRCVGRVLDINTLPPLSSLKPKILGNADDASF